MEIKPVVISDPLTKYPDELHQKKGLFPNLCTSIGNKNIIFPDTVFALDTTREIPPMCTESHFDHLF